MRRTPETTAGSGSTGTESRPHRLLAAPALIVWVVSAVVLRGAVLLPERCGAPSTGRLAQSAGAAVDWFDRNQRPDGTWLYRWDRTTGTDLGGYTSVRHAGALLALYQAAATDPGALAIADRGRGWALGQVVPVGSSGAALADGSRSGPLPAGGAALLVAALVERRDRTGDRQDDALLARLGRFLVGQVESDGSVADQWAGGAPVAGTRSPFTTGEVLFALERLARVFPTDPQWADAADPVVRYVIRDRARVEGYVPDVSDHWSAYAFAERARRVRLSPDERRWARRQMGVISIQIRYESQRTGGLDRWVRGRPALGAGLGTLGEAAAQWSTIDGRMAARARCAAGVLVRRQVSVDAAAPQARGAWFQFGVTQVDDQQHPLSALVTTAATLTAAERSGAALPKGSPVPSSWGLLVLALAALGASTTGAVRTRARVVAGVMGAVAAAAGPAALRALSVTAPSGVIGGALVLAVLGLVGVVAPGSDRRAAALVPGVLLAAAASAAGRWWAALLGVGAAVALTGLGRVPERSRPGVARAAAAVALAVSVALIVDAVYAI